MVNHYVFSARLIAHLEIVAFDFDNDYLGSVTRGWLVPIRMRFSLSRMEARGNGY